MNNTLQDLKKIKAETDSEYKFTRDNISYLIIVRYRIFINSKKPQYGLQIYNETNREYEVINKRGSNKEISLFKTKNDLLDYLNKFFKKG